MKKKECGNSHRCLLLPDGETLALDAWGHVAAETGDVRHLSPSTITGVAVVHLRADGSALVKGMREVLHSSRGRLHVHFSMKQPCRTCCYSIVKTRVFSCLSSKHANRAHGFQREAVRWYISAYFVTANPFPNRPPFHKRRRGSKSCLGESFNIQGWHKGPSVRSCWQP